MEVKTQEGRKELILLRKHTHEGRICTKCKRLLALSRFGKNRNRKRADCRECMANHKRMKRIEDGYLNHSVINHRSRSLKAGLPSNMTVETRERILGEQNGVCVLTGSNEITVEHFIPISWGYGLGDVYENVVYLSSRTNNSKGNKYPFHWIESQPSTVQERFYSVLVPMLAKHNQMTVQDYKAYVKHCFQMYSQQQQKTS